jgi:hypothetical protein
MDALISIVCFLHSKLASAMPALSALPEVSDPIETRGPWLRRRDGSSLCAHARAFNAARLCPPARLNCQGSREPIRCACSVLSTPATCYDRSSLRFDLSAVVSSGHVRRASSRARSLGF